MAKHKTTNTPVESEATVTEMEQPKPELAYIIQDVPIMFHRSPYTVMQGSECLGTYCREKAIAVARGINK